MIAEVRRMFIHLVGVLMAVAGTCLLIVFGILVLPASASIGWSVMVAMTVVTMRMRVQEMARGNGMRAWGRPGMAARAFVVSVLSIGIVGVGLLASPGLTALFLAPTLLIGAAVCAWWLRCHPVGGSRAGVPGDVMTGALPEDAVPVDGAAGNRPEERPGSGLPDLGLDRLPAHIVGTNAFPGALGLLSTEDLCGAWRTSYVALQRAEDAVAVLRISAARQDYLDELERRDRFGFGLWLVTGASVASDPGQFIAPGG